jgi:hypothetical protein
LEIESRFLPRSTWTTILLFHESCFCWDDRHSPLCPVFLLLRWGLENFFFFFNLGWPWTCMLPISWKVACRWQAPATVSGYWLRWGLTNFLSGAGLGKNLILPISASQVARVTGVNLQCLVSGVFWSKSQMFGHHTHKYLQMHPQLERIPFHVTIKPSSHLPWLMIFFEWYLNTYFKSFLRLRRYFYFLSTSS